MIYPRTHPEPRRGEERAQASGLPAPRSTPSRTGHETQASGLSIPCSGDDTTSGAAPRFTEGPENSSPPTGRPRLKCTGWGELCSQQWSLARVQVVIRLAPAPTDLCSMLRLSHSGLPGGVRAATPRMLPSSTHSKQVSHGEGTRGSRDPPGPYAYPSIYTPYTQPSLSKLRAVSTPAPPTPLYAHTDVHTPPATCGLQDRRTSRQPAGSGAEMVEGPRGPES